MVEPFRNEGAAPPRSILIASPAPEVPIRQGQRIQRSRRKGARLPLGAIYVGRPTIWGNPFTIDKWGHARCVILHRHWLRGEMGALTLENMGFCSAEIEALERKRIACLTRLHELAGQTLACWCPLTSAWCHADSYLAMAPHYAALERYVP